MASEKGTAYEWFFKEIEPSNSIYMIDNKTNILFETPSIYSM